jgi:hypothetical protein
VTTPQGGRPALLTPERQDRIVQAVKAGNYLKVAAQWAGVGESTLRVWLQRGRRASAAVDAHDPDHLYCPGCDSDRTAAVRSLEESARAAEERQEAGYPVLGHCPACRSREYPRPWQLPEREEPFLRFLSAVTEAESSAEVAAVTHWRAAFPEDWRAARDYLRYRQPERWSPVTRVSVTPEEAERRIEEAFVQVLTSVGVDVDPAGEPLLDDAAAAALEGLDLDGDDWPEEGESGD